mgnify:CR=1 FL=1
MTDIKSNSYSCPLRMMDGRIMTDYRPRCIVNADLINNMGEKNIVKSSYETRMYLQKNADDIIKKSFENTKQNLVPCIPCKKPVGDGTMLPEKYLVTCDATSCTRKPFNPNGLGDGRKADLSLYSQNNN